MKKSILAVTMAFLTALSPASSAMPAILHEQAEVNGIPDFEDSEDTSPGFWDALLDFLKNGIRWDKKPLVPVDPEPDPSETIVSGHYIYWINKDNETVTISDYTGDEEVVEIPSEIDGHPVSAIGHEAFSYKHMRVLSFPDCVSTIGNRAFEYTVIENELVLPENAVIKEGAFSYAKLPSAITIPEGTAAEESAFSYCKSLKQVFVGTDAAIQSQAFGYCDELEQVTCAQGSRLESGAFEYCHALEKVTLCGEVNMAVDAFQYCENAMVTRTGE